MLNQLEKWSLIEESVMKRKSRASWIKLWDSNTKYFSVIVKEKTQKKQFRELTSLDGQTLTDPEEIKQEIINFYKSLMGRAAQSLPAINREFMKQGPTLHNETLIVCRCYRPGNY